MKTSLAFLVLTAALVLGCAGGGKDDPDSGPPDAGEPWPGCPQIAPDGSLAAKAAAFDQVASQRHLGPDGLLRNVYLTADLSSVQEYQHVENVILWSGMYLASQAFRYAVTGEAEAQDNARRVLVGLTDLTRITGVSGLYGRSLDRPDVTYNFDGRGTESWTESTAPGYEGWAFRNDVSKDGYAGLMFGYAAALEHFDDPALLEQIRARLREVADHIVGNGLQIVDTDGLVTEHGALYHTAFDDFPGFNAMLASSWVKIAAVDLQDQALDDFYYGCLMETRDGVTCPDIEVMDFGTYIESMEKFLYLFQPDCKQNYDNFDMCYQAMYPLLRREVDPDLRARLIDVVETNMFHTEDARYQSMAEIGWAFFTYAYVASTGVGSGDDPVIDHAVELAACNLHAFPDEKVERPIPAGTQPEVCRTRLDEPAAAEPIPLAERRWDNYLWRLDPFKIMEGHPGDPRQIYSPEDYLVAYWLGRLHGILTEDM